MMRRCPLARRQESFSIADETSHSRAARSVRRRTQNTSLVREPVFCIVPPHLKQLQMTNMHNPPHPGEVLREWLADISVTDAAQLELFASTIPVPSRYGNSPLTPGVAESTDHLLTC
jgi:hypothetical protein